MSKFLTEKYQRLKPYTPGEQPRDKRYLKLNTNESPFPPSPKACELAASELERVMLYPDPEQVHLTSLLASTYGVEPCEVLATNGSDEGLNFAFMAYCDENNPAVFADITYGFYRVFADLYDLPKTIVPLAEDFSLRIDDYIGKKGTVFIANPNAPTGIALPPSEIERLLISDRERIVVVDEAYVDFGAESCVPLTKKYDNLLVVGTFSKSRSMAGARLGYAIGNKEIIGDLARIKYSTNPYNVNRMTAAMGVGALMDADYFEDNCRKIIAAREYTALALAALGFDLTPSVSNFLFAKSDKIDGEKLYLSLKERGVLVRHFSGERISEYNRITIGSMEQMQTFIDIIKDIMENLV